MGTKFTENLKIKFAQQTLLLVLVTRRFVFLCIAKRVTGHGMNSTLSLWIAKSNEKSGIRGVEKTGTVLYFDLVENKIKCYKTFTKE